MPNHYDLLGVPRSATQEEIRRAYRTKALTCHPDRNKSPAAAQQFRELTDAYNILRDPFHRGKYDKSLSAHSTVPDSCGPQFEGPKDLVPQPDKYHADAAEEELKKMRQLYEELLKNQAQGGSKPSATSTPSAADVKAVLRKALDEQDAKNARRDKEMADMMHKMHLRDQQRDEEIKREREKADRERVLREKAEADKREHELKLREQVERERIQREAAEEKRRKAEWESQQAQLRLEQERIRRREQEEQDRLRREQEDADRKKRVQKEEEAKRRLPPTIYFLPAMQVSYGWPLKANGERDYRYKYKRYLDADGRPVD
ncbi:hypothetical protein H9P43_009657 [Blastocladiella emersonii ATCC 22665]|nr:hypothetical protein H9P43_009657 [Blastocladiella emersonii ATCC 22665]